MGRRMNRCNLRLLQNDLGLSFGWLDSTHPGQSFLLGSQMCTIGAILLNENFCILAWLSTNANPVIDPLPLENRTRIFLTAHRIVVAEFLEDSPVAWVPLIDGAQAIKRSTLAAHPLHSNSYRHRLLSNGNKRIQGEQMITSGLVPGE